MKLVSTLPPLYPLLKHHAVDQRSKEDVAPLLQLLLWVDPRCRSTSSRACGRDTKKKKGWAKVLSGPTYFSLRAPLVRGSLFLWLLLFSCDPTLFVISLSFRLLCVCVCLRVCVCIPACRHVMFGERKCETDSYDSYFNLFREYCCTGAVHWVAPACQVCLIMQKEQKNALQMSEFLPKETEIWQTSSTLREQWCKIPFCQM